jgi:phosphorylase/glycogen(starch) synthase
MIQKEGNPDWIFEVSWEVCNKVGGIYTVISTKAPVLDEILKDHLVTIGPDVGQVGREGSTFIEDKDLFPEWREHLKQSNLKVKMGHWDIPSRPIALLIDFSDFFDRKDDILTQLWTKFRVDSLTGGWDYIEPVIFGYVAGMVVDNFYHFYLGPQVSVIAQFHEWMTVSGLLYLKDKLPQVGTAFTTHATVLGRCIAGNNFPLYDDLEKYDPVALAKEFNVTAKQSIEKQGALCADVFTTVSEITARECRHFLDKAPDVITPNGFDAKFIPVENFDQRRADARKKLISVAEAVLNQPIDKDCLLIAKSGRYEFRNKGVDVFLDAIHKLNVNENLRREVVVFIAIPAGHTGPIHDVVNRIDNPDYKNPLSNQFLTHGLSNYNEDPIITRIKNNNLTNRPGDKVKIIFAPVYLDGHDGVFNMEYYDLLTGFDFSAFPSYYEPWGYTPLESLASRIPTITTTLAGFGNWVVKDMPDYLDDGIYVVHRTDTNQDECSATIARIIYDYTNLSKARVTHLRKRASELAQKANWDEFVKDYLHAYAKALHKAHNRQLQIKETRSKVKASQMQAIAPNVDQDPAWRKLYVQPKVPAKFQILQTLAFNLWTNWNYEARELFEMMDPENWKRFKFNPTATLEAVSYERLLDLEKDEAFSEKLKNVEKAFTKYMFERNNLEGTKVAYFCMEYGLDPFIKLYSGGLGILAGDYLKEASDAKTNMVAVGLLYRYGYFKQQLDANGAQQALYKPQKFSYLPIQPVKHANDTWMSVFIDVGDHEVFAKVWKLQVGSVPLYLLDTDIDLNRPEDRFITHQLYGGDWDNRLKQELLLGIGGIRLLKMLGIESEVYHCNEGHAAFTGLERARYLIKDKGMNFSEAAEVIRGSSLFTTHTPVPAGHDAFAEEDMYRYFGNYVNELKINWQEFVSLGRSRGDDSSEKFSMSFLASRLSSRINGVSRLHGTVSKGIFQPLHPGYFAQEINIDYVTNGVHYPTWASTEWQKLYKESLGDGFYENQHKPEHWAKIYELPDAKIWAMRQEHKSKMIEWVKSYLRKNLNQQHQSPKAMMSVINSLDQNALIIGFARRFATYKRASLLFEDLDRLAQIVNDPKRPVIFFFSGKAHPMDIPGQDLIRRVVEVSNLPQFLGKVIFLEDYDMTVARNLVRGVDIWLNTPTRPMEASGTSGMKATLNGVLNLSVLDGWWAEGYRPGTGWALPEKNDYEYEEFQNEYDAETIYHMLEREIKPMFYNREAEGIPVEWVQRIKKTIAEIAPEFTMSRMLGEYQSKFYKPLQARKKQLTNDNYKTAKDIAEWKKYISDHWEAIKVESMDVFDSTNQSLELGEMFTAQIVLNLGELKPEDIAVEVVFIRKHRSDEITELVSCDALKLVNADSAKATYEGAVKTSRSGVYEYGFRIYPTNPLLENRMEFSLIKWI